MGGSSNIEDDDIVCSLWKHRAGYYSGHRLTTYAEHKGVLLPNFNVSNKEYDYLSDGKQFTNNIRTMVSDADSPLFKEPGLPMLETA